MNLRLVVGNISSYPSPHLVVEYEIDMSHGSALLLYKKPRNIDPAGGSYSTTPIH